jgi:thiamine biosynthesis lipoprotein
LYLYQFEAFTTPCELHIEALSNATADYVAHTIITSTKQLESRYSFFQKTSEVYAVNNRSENSLTISDEFAGLLEIAFFYHKMTQGVFDIALAGTLKAVFKAPSQDDYQKLKNTLLPFSSSEHINLAGNRLFFNNDYTKIDFGGLVKEYAVDQAVLQLQSCGITSALVNFGGDIAAFGTCHDKPWKIGIQDPCSADLNVIEVELNNVSLCTSGHSKRFTTIENETISHIIGINQINNKCTQISVMAPTTVDAGVWSTTLLINPNLNPPHHIDIINLYQ